MNKFHNIHDIDDFIFIPFWKTNAFIATLIVLLIAILGTIGFILWRKYKKNKQLKVVLTPTEWAVQQLTSLTPESYEKKEEFKHFYFEMAQITKKYLFKKFHWEVLEKTDQELIPYLQEKQFEPAQTKKLETVLEGSLLIKFADAQALREQAVRDLKEIKTFVQSSPDA